MRATGCADCERIDASLSALPEPLVCTEPRADGGGGAEDEKERWGAAAVGVGSSSAEICPSRPESKLDEEDAGL